MGHHYPPQFYLRNFAAQGKRNKYYIMKRRIFDLLGIEVIVNDADDWKRIRLTGRITEQVLSTVLAEAFAGFLVAYSAVLA